MTEQDCLNALTGRTIKSIEWQSPAEECLIVETHDNLKFEIGAVDSYISDPYLNINQVKDNE